MQRITAVQFSEGGGPRRVVAVDWSGAAIGAGRGIWLADVRTADAHVVELRGGWTRERIADHLVALAAEEPRLVVGLDFAFSLPGWFLEEQGYATAAALWDDADTCERWATQCPPPFWGRGSQPTRPRDLEPVRRLRRAEREVSEHFAVEPKSPFQLGGAGSVGTGSLRGMRVLARLRAGGFHIWPFDPPQLPMVVEIYPRLFVPGVRVSDHESRAAYLDRHGWPGDAALRAVAATNPNAFDAVIAAFGMAGAADELAALEPARDELDRLEGRVWAPGAGARTPKRPSPGFFATLESQRPRVAPRPQPPNPPWMGPPDDVVGIGVPGQHVIGRSDSAAVIVDGITAFPAGLSLSAVLLTREPMKPRRTFFGMRDPSDDGAEGTVRIGVELPDGSRADATRPWLPHRPGPRHAVLVPRNGGGGGTRWRQELWLWPLPGPGAMRFVCRWDDENIAETELVLRTEPLIEAASRAWRLFEKE